MPCRDVDLALPSGRVRVRAWGAAGPAVVCVHGLSANLAGMDAIGTALADSGFRTLVPDLRGRGHSEVTPRGTYGWPAHAADVVAIADKLGAERFDIVGWSMGAMVGMQVVALAPGRCRRMVLIDACGPVSAPALALIERGVTRLGAVHPSLPGYVEMVRGLNMVRPWSPYWERYYAYEMGPVAGGWQARTSRTAVEEDLDWGRTHDARDLWAGLRGPTLLLRATQPLLPDVGHIVEEAVRDEFLAAAPGARLAEVDANHYGIVADPSAARAIVGFLTEKER
jgi:3-oxoadipate enol-lactonase